MNTVANNVQGHAMALMVACLPLTASAKLLEPAPVRGVPTPKLETQAVVDVKALLEDYDATGTMSIPVRGSDVVLELNERNLFGPRGREIWEVNEDATEARLVGHVTARPFAGLVRGAENTYVTITLDDGTSSIFGTVYMDERAYSLIGEPDAAGRTILRTVWAELPRPAPDYDDGIRPLAVRDTYIRVFSDANYRNYASNWQTRITSAFNAAHDMWRTQTEIHQWHGPFTSITGAWSTTCSTHLDSFESHVQSGINSGTYTGSDSYQLFTGVDISNAHGCANSYNTITMGHKDASSLLEAVDHSCCDTYDPDETHNLGIVSASELGHVYGEEDHPTDQRCEWYWWSGGPCGDWTYNVMAGGYDQDERGFWFTSGSSTKSANRIKAESWPQL